MSKEAEGERRRLEGCRGDRRSVETKERRAETTKEKRRSPVKRIKSDQEDIRRIFSKKLRRQREKFGFRHSMSSSWRVGETNRELGRDLSRELDGEE